MHISAEVFAATALQFLALFSTTFVALTMYQRCREGSSKYKLPDDVSVVLVPLAIVFLATVRSLEDAVVAGMLVALVEFIRSQFKMPGWLRYILWAGALLTTGPVLPYDWLLADQVLLANVALLFVLWYLSVYVMIQYSGRRHYDAYLLPLFVGMHTVLIWAIPNIPNQIGNDILMLGALILGYALWRDTGGNVRFGQATTGFAAVWMGYIWLQMALHSHIPAILILVAYPLMSRVVGRFDRGRQLVKDGRGHLILVAGSGVVTSLALITCQDDIVTEANDWMIVFVTYIVVTVTIIANRHERPVDAA